jgi:tetratricopeptide (TPR) repeat protein
MTSKERLDQICRADDAGMVARTRELCEAFLLDFPENGAVWIMLAENLKNLHLYEKAEAALDKAERWAGDHRGRKRLVVLQRGHLLTARGDHHDAEKSFMKAHLLMPENAGSLIFAGVAAMQRGNLAKAAELLTEATRCPEGAIDEAYFNLGGVFLALRQYGEAAGCYTKALEIDSGNALYRKRLSDLETVLG